MFTLTNQPPAVRVDWMWTVSVERVLTPHPTCSPGPTHLAPIEPTMRSTRLPESVLPAGVSARRSGSSRFYGRVSDPAARLSAMSWDRMSSPSTGGRWLRSRDTSTCSTTRLRRW